MPVYKRLFFALLAACLLAALQPAPYFGQSPAQAAGATFYVATNGSDSSGNGSASRPWSTITNALRRVPGGSTILVRPGTYTGQVRLQGRFAPAVTVRSEQPYMARLRNDDQVVVGDDPMSGIIFEGFDVAHSRPGSGVLVVHINGGRKLGLVTNLVLRNNIFHDSYNNDLMKVDGSSSFVTVEGNLFYNQAGSDEHMDINSAANILVQNNIFMNDFGGSGRPNNNDTGSFIMIKDSGGSNDELIGSRNITLRRNVFLNWEGLPSSGFIMVGEDGHPYFEADGVLVENNLMLGNSNNNIISAMAVWGARNVTFRNNTVSGDLPGNSFAMMLNKAGENPLNQNIQFYNNIWSDPTGSMGAHAGSPYNDFSDTRAGKTSSFAISNNLYWNGGKAIPQKSEDVINYTDDSKRVVANPQLANPHGVVLPRWKEGEGRFADGSRTIREAFVRLVEQYAKLPSGSPAVNKGDARNAPTTDILGRARNGTPDIGAYEGGEPLSVQTISVDHAIYVSWKTGAKLPAGTTWVLSYEGPAGDSPSPVELSGDERGIWLRGLDNYYPYQITLTAQANGQAVFRASRRAFATDHHIVLPFIRH